VRHAWPVVMEASASASAASATAVTAA
jgi:hypothetical protein